MLEHNTFFILMHVPTKLCALCTNRVLLWDEMTCTIIDAFAMLEKRIVTEIQYISPITICEVHFNC